MQLRTLRILAVGLALFGFGLISAAQSQPTLPAGMVLIPAGGVQMGTASVRATPVSCPCTR